MSVPVAETEKTLPTTVTYIGYHAAGRPGAVALTINGQTITYAAFYRDISRMVLGLRALGLAPGQTLAVEHSHFYLHWLIILACEAMGVTSCSYEKGEISVLDKAFARTDMALCQAGNEPPNVKSVHFIDKPWVDSVMARSPEIPIETAPLRIDTPMRVVKSSGTTGHFKCMVQPWQFRELYLEQYQFRAGFNRDSRFLVIMGLVVEPYSIYASDCVRMGGTCIIGGQDNLAENLIREKITHLVVPPYILMQLLDSLADNYVKPDNLIVITIGAAVSKEVRNRVKRVLANDVVESYGAQEIGVVATMDEDGVGALLPGVEAEVLDDADQPVIGQPGRVRVRATVSVGGYIDDPEATAHMFQGGWFYPGDLAVMPDKTSLKLIGRVDDTLNIRGLKFAPGPLEEVLRNELPVDDLCISAVVDNEGNNQLCVVIVLQDHDALAAIQGALASRFSAHYGTVKLMIVPSIPRTATSKIRRAELKAMLQREGGGAAV